MGVAYWVNEKSVRSLLPHQLRDARAHGLDLARGRARAGGDSDHVCSLEPLGSQLVRALDVVRARAAGRRYLGEARRVGGVAPADDHDDVGLARELVGGRLMSRGGLADGVDDADLFGSVEQGFDDLGEQGPAGRGLNDDADQVQ